MQYLDKTELLKNVPYHDISSEELVSADSYNEEEIMRKFVSFDKNTQELLLKCAIHVSVIGSGNKTFGSIRDKVNSNNVFEIKTILDKFGILYNKNINEKYQKDALSIRRLVRLLRYHIQKFIETNNRPSYLWLKYSDRDKTMMNICFPGGEHLIENIEQAKYLLNTYKILDKNLNTKFQVRLERVFIARGIIKPSYLLPTDKPK